MTVFLVSPAEPPSIKVLGNTSDLVETYGADILWADQRVGGFIGVQRKEYSDLLNSVEDGRLQREIQQLPRCKQSFLVVEGRPYWTTEGKLNHRYLGRWTREAYMSLLRDVMFRGIIVEYTDNTTDTVAYVQHLAKWIAKGEHHSLDRRPPRAPDRWGQKTHRGSMIHFLQSFDGVGPKQAAVMLDGWGGELPLRWTITKSDLLKIKGIGKETVKVLANLIPMDD